MNIMLPGTCGQIFVMLTENGTSQFISNAKLAMGFMREVAVGNE